MTPITSWPGMRGYWMPGKRPSTVTESLWQTPQACTRMRISPARGSGISRSTASNFPPTFGTTIARIFAMSCLLAVGRERSELRHNVDARRFLRVHPRPFLPICHVNSVLFDNTHRLYGVPLEFDRNASAGLRRHLNGWAGP